MGRLQREQGRAASHERDLERGARRRRRALPVDRSRRHGHAAARARRARRGSVDAEAALGVYARAARRDRGRAAAGARSLQASGPAMIAATHATQRPTGAKLLVVDARGRITDTRRRNFVDCLRPGDLAIANDAATLPASLFGVHEPTGAEIEVRLAGRRSLSSTDVKFSAIVFGAGDFHTPTERRPPPPPLSPGDRLALGPLHATIVRLVGHPRLIAIDF